jgi:uncharacterized protein (TIGR02118 family)
MGHTVYVLRRKSGLTREAFQKYWREVHGPLVASHAEALGITRYVQMHTLDAAREDELRGPMADPYDGVAELWWDAARATASEAVRKAALRALVEDELNFIDLARSSKWFSEDHAFVGDVTQ